MRKRIEELERELSKKTAEMERITIEVANRAHFEASLRHRIEELYGLLARAKDILPDCGLRDEIGWALEQWKSYKAKKNANSVQA